MRQLSGLDTAFLNLETKSTPLHVASVITVDPTTAPNGFTFEGLLEHLRSRLHLLPPLRWRLVEVPLGLDQPYWIDDPDFDLEYHVRRIAVPSPGDDRTLAELVQRIHARQLDRARPLWEVYFIEGYRPAGADGPRVAIYSKNHHAAIDGVSGAEMLTVLLDLEPDAQREQPAPVEAEPEPSDIMMMLRAARGVVRGPLRLAQTTAKAVGQLPELLRLTELPLPFLDRSGDGVLARPSLQAPRTMFNAPIGPHRRWSFATMSLTEVKRIKSHHGVTVNDVVMTICAAALRRYLLDRGALPGQPLQAMVPISVRKDDQRSEAGNQVSAMIATLPTHLDDPLDRLLAQAGAMGIAKERNAVPADLIQDVTRVAAPALAATAARTIAALRWAERLRTPFNVVISNVPGPPVPIYYNGARMEHIYPVSAIADGVGLNITVFSYIDSIDIGIVVDRDMTPDAWVLTDLVVDALEELGKLTPSD